MADRRLLMIPGPIEFEPDVLAALGERTRSHLDPVFIDAFGRVIERCREVFLAGKDSQPFVVAGSGTLAMDMAIANTLEPGDSVVVVDTGYFSARMLDLVRRWGGNATRVAGPVGDTPSLDEIRSAISSTKAKLVTVTHVDTSTGVRADVEQIASIAREHDALVIVDGVCSIGGEELRQEAWGIDIALTASQKAIGVPPGLALLVASSRALAACRQKGRKPSSLYLDFAEWLPVMEAYEARKPYYFATPPVNLISALDASLTQILAEGMEQRFARHAQLAAACRAAFRAMQLSQLPLREEVAANTLSALFYPEGIDGTFPAKLAAEGIIVAGGLLPALKSQYFRIGHMGALNASDVLATIGALERALAKLGQARSGIAAASQALANMKTT